MNRISIVADSFIPFLRGRLEAYADITYPHPDDINAAAVKDANALLIRTRTRCNASLLADSRVSFIASGTIGMDQFDLPWCREHGIACFNSPGCNAPGVAQYVWSALLHLRLNPARLTVGIVGHGHVGRIVAEWGRLLGAHILLCDPPLAEAVGEGYLSLAEMLPQCDVVTLHTPLTRTGDHATYHLMGERELALMKKRAILINAARGPVVDTTAVVKAAQNGSIRLITDCWEGEPDHISPEQLELSLIATPHVAGYSLQGKQRATRMIIENLADTFALPVARTPEQEGIKVWDLPEPYRPVAAITAHDIISSYDPLADDALLRRNPARFEWLRDHYNFRSEPLMSTAPTICRFPALDMRDALEEGRVNDFIRILKQLFRQYPYDLRLHHESDFHRLLYAMLMLTGTRVEAEHHSALGRIDLLIHTARFVYILELKCDSTAIEAIRQIESRDYARGLGDPSSIIKCGINFDSRSREIDSWGVVDNENLKFL